MSLPNRQVARLFALAMVWLLAASVGPGGAAAGGTLTAPTCKGSLRTVASTAELRDAFRDVRRGFLAAGSVIRLKTETFRLARDGEPLSLDNVIGTSEECPITVEGSGPGTLLDGNRYPQNTQFGHLLRAASSEDARQLLDVQPKVFELKSIGMPKEAPINCLKIERASWIVISNIDISGCWPTAVYLRDARYITVRGGNISGSTYAIIAHGRSHHILIEDTVWTQDTSGDVWARIPWGVSHHGSKAHLNGALFGGYNIKGSVVIRRNVVRHAYNGIRIKSTCKTNCDSNMNVEIYDNTFEFIRDNSIEPEGSAANWWVRHNKMQDVHAPFSFDGVRGGPHYVFGNVGWFTQMPEEQCEDEAWANDREWLGTLTAHRQCRRHRMGKTFKLGNVQEKPLYVFHNSWLSRSPLIGGGRSGPLWAWNNAVEFCSPADTVAGVICKAPSHFMAAGGRNKFKWISRSKTRKARHNIRYNVSNLPVFPDGSKWPSFPLEGRWAGKLGFMDARNGDFRLRSQSAARQAGCMIQESKAGDLTCKRPPDRLSPDAGAYQGQTPFKGPSFRHMDSALGPDFAYPERPRVVDVEFNGMQPDRFKVSFSVPIKLEKKAVSATVRLTGGEGAVTALCTVGQLRPAELTCVMPTDRVRGPNVAAIELPRQINRAAGQSARMTLWASTDPRLKFAD